MNGLLTLTEAHIFPGPLHLCYFQVALSERHKIKLYLTVLRHCHAINFYLSQVSNKHIHKLA